ncbi:cysteine--1-D-myo-inosityl 2-amino-2-deoxy-alpha-D-glucopyranoside ligase [Gordonia sp. (in: high G+C Gram-positive bacteria)]|uniref:cysteine--1-D-myo-inosityl 2-amino-2-deoxy-alpha-D-glucopyranoside ligase n=1 Tax=Gordonia sp. (in: high G+C Gram-positive bacteria) TaxID=84139 RepID=UPI00169DF065|nr:cysteine--1-D-myo-inosityl 2-amino-2-deoxy-alpha-D-glucopyranoside ligase [Gordonia sp. (in: high G+C Gram-positive bacteria)]NLG47053.1 cysteine--1-D-myo-inosityl 2-amino-2-deoxy-alpha-D-glucopyranoside ligase [Gordonia sp. (in: high G+C Gram-positive bacteria)]
MHSWPSLSIPSVPGPTVPLRLYDTSDAQVKPVSAGEVATMYVCGITPYDATHLGHAATYVTFDVINRVLRDSGHDVHYVQNITDVDDPLFERAARDGVDWRDLGTREIDLFRADMEALRVLPPRDYIGAIESVDEVIAAVGTLLANGSAYVVDDEQFPDVYFSVEATAQFGYESGYDHATMARFFAERGGDPDRPGKRNPLDALLWRAAREGEPSWESPMGPGRPGWHIECSAIALNRLGMGFDIQGGGSDLIFPHHEFSAAHGEALTGERRFARHYVHTGMIGLDGEKMSKSLGNLVLVSKLRAAGVDPGAVRLGLLSGHYRSDRMWTDDILAEGERRLANWRRAVRHATGPTATDTVARLRQHLADDLDTPKALAAVDAWMADAHLGIGSSTEAPGLMIAAVDALLGVDLTPVG